MTDKEHIEAHVAQIFLERHEGRPLSIEDLNFGDPQKHEPDILYKDMGIEIGAVLKGLNTHIDIFEQQFVSAATERIAGKIPETIQIRLVMQDDNDVVLHTPTPQFQQYRYLPKYLDGMFVCQFEASQVQQKIILNQKTRMRALTFPSNVKSNEFKGFIDELAEFVNDLKPSDFIECEDCKLHHSLVTDGKVVKETPDPLDAFASPKILEKLSKEKYQGNYTRLILLLHNYSILGNREFTSDIHFYTHHRNDIFNLLWDRINEYASFSRYHAIYFLDFSLYAGNRNFELIDFHHYSVREPSRFLHGYNEIRCDLRTAYHGKGD